MKATQMTTISDLVLAINVHPMLDRKPVTATTFKKKSDYVDLLARLDALTPTDDEGEVVVYDDAATSDDDTAATDDADDATTDDDDTVLTVKEYAYDVGVSAKLVRHVLRQMSNDKKYTRYSLDAPTRRELDKRFVKN